MRSIIQLSIFLLCFSCSLVGTDPDENSPDIEERAMSGEQLIVRDGSVYKPFKTLAELRHIQRRTKEINAQLANRRSICLFSILFFLSGLVFPAAFVGFGLLDHSSNNCFEEKLQEWLTNGGALNTTIGEIGQAVLSDCGMNYE